MKNRKNHNRPERDQEPGSIEKGREALKKLGILLLNFILFYALLRIIIALSESTGQLWIYYAGTLLYGIAGGAAFVAFFVLNGFSLENKPRTIDELPETWSYEKKSEFMAKQPGNRKKAKTLIYILMPIVVSLAISYIELYIMK